MYPFINTNDSVVITICIKTFCSYIIFTIRVACNGHHN